MGLRSTVFSLLSGPVLQAIDQAVRTRVEEALARADLVSPAELKELGRRLDAASRSMADLRSEVSACQATVAALGETGGPDVELDERVSAVEARDAALAARIDGLQASLSGLSDDLVTLRQRLGDAERRVDTSSGAASAAQQGAAAVRDQGLKLVAPADAGCKVPGCTGTHRAKGYCGKHYQMWKRGTLPATA